MIESWWSVEERDQEGSGRREKWVEHSTEERRKAWTRGERPRTGNCRINVLICMCVSLLSNVS